jgi:hypothetical protein
MLEGIVPGEGDPTLPESIRQMSDRLQNLERLVHFYEGYEIHCANGRFSVLAQLVSRDVEPHPWKVTVKEDETLEVAPGRILYLEALGAFSGGGGGELMTPYVTREIPFAGGTAERGTYLYAKVPVNGIYSDPPYHASNEPDKVSYFVTPGSPVELVPSPGPLAGVADSAYYFLLAIISADGEVDQVLSHNPIVQVGFSTTDGA